MANASTWKRMLVTRGMGIAALGAVTAVIIYPQAVIDTVQQLPGLNASEYRILPPPMALGSVAPPEHQPEARATLSVAPQSDQRHAFSDFSVAPGVSGSVDEASLPVADPEADASGDVLAGFRDIEIEAARRIGYVPRGGLDGIPDLDGPNQPVRMIGEDVRLVGPVDLETPHGSWRLAGTLPFGLADNCKNTQGEEYDCLTWSHEGMRHLVDAGPLRCLPVEWADEALSVAQCSVLVGGEWFDISEWGVLAGMAYADPDGDLVPFQRLAQAARVGVWEGTFRPFGAPEIGYDITNIDPTEGFQPSFRTENSPEI